jgi:hypothetical protein
MRKLFNQIESVCFHGNLKEGKQEVQVEIMDWNEHFFQGFELYSSHFRVYL